MLVKRQVYRSGGYSRPKRVKVIDVHVPGAPTKPFYPVRKHNYLQSKRLLKKRGLYDPVYIDVPWTYSSE